MMSSYRDFRTQSCMTFGNGSNILTMNLNLLAKQGTSEYCGILVSNVGPEVITSLINNNLINNYYYELFSNPKYQRAEERSVQIAVRIHKTLELADDKFYVITCGRSYPKWVEISNIS